MLVLSRRSGERIIVTVPPSDKPTTVEVILVEVNGVRARLGFEAPRQVSIHRQEVYDAMKRDQERKEQAKDGGPSQG